jgi:molybdopterin molybdotransferase
MIRYEDALAIVRAAAAPLPSERLALQAARGRVSAEAIDSAVSVPRFAGSAMDGFAVIARGPARRLLRRKIVAGDAPFGEAIGADEAVAIMTGAPMPPGADAVVKIEDVQRDGEAVVLPSVTAGQFVRGEGEDFRPGARVVERGVVLTPERLMAIGAVGLGEVAVVRRPRVAVIPTGRELTSPGEPLIGPGAIWSASSVYLQTALAPWADVTLLPIVRDDVRHFHRVLDEARADVVITTGAVSMGEHDFVPQALADRGAQIAFHKMATRPAKPTLFARLGERVVFGLAGNPISTAIGCRFLVTPFLRAALGLPAEQPQRLPAVFKKPADLKCFYKCKLDRGVVTVLAGQDSHLIRPLTEANAWGATNETADTLDVHPLQIVD